MNGESFYRVEDQEDQVDDEAGETIVLELLELAEEGAKAFADGALAR